MPFSPLRSLIPSVAPTANTAILSQESVVQAECDGQANSGPSSADNLLVLETNTDVPGQMPQAVEAVEEEGESVERLQSGLHSRWPSSDSGYH